MPTRATASANRSSSRRTRWWWAPRVRRAARLSRSELEGTWGCGCPQPACVPCPYTPQAYAPYPTVQAPYVPRFSLVRVLSPALVLDLPGIPLPLQFHCALLPGSHSRAMAAGHSCRNLLHKPRTRRNRQFRSRRFPSYPCHRSEEREREESIRQAYDLCNSASVRG